MAPSSPSTLYAWTSAGLFRSDDGGAKWTRRASAGLVAPFDANGIPLGRLGELVLVAADNPDIVFAMGLANGQLDSSGTPSNDVPGLFRSTDGGNTWSQVMEGTAGLVVADPENPSTLFAVPPETTGVLKSTDLGTTWTALAPGQWVDPIVSIAVDPSTPSVVYVVQ